MINLVKIVKSGPNCEIWSKLWNLVKIVKSGQYCEIWSKLWNLVEIVKSGQTSENSWFGMVCMVWFGFVGSKFQHSQWVTNMAYNQGGHRAARAAKNWKCKYCLVCNLLEIPFCRRDWPSSVFAITINQIPLLAYFHLLFPSLFLFNLPRSFFFFSWLQNLHHTLWAESFWPISWST